MGSPFGCKVIKVATKPKEATGFCSRDVCPSGSNSSLVSVFFYVDLFVGLIDTDKSR